MDSVRASRGINRRRFLSSTAAAGAGIAFAPMVSAVVREPVDNISVAIIGAGAQGQVLIASCLKIPGLRFKAVCDIWQYNLKRTARYLRKYKHQLTEYSDYEEMLAREPDLDAVIVATPDFWHARHSIACMEGGLHVYCEKEMSNVLEDARKMVETSRKTGKLLQIGHQRRSNPRYLHCREKLLGEAEILGRITTINGQWNRAARGFNGWPKGLEIEPKVLEKYGYESMQQCRNWRWYKGLGGGPIVDLGSHQIDIYNWFLNARPKSVTARGAHDYYDNATHQWYDTVMAIYNYDTPKGGVSAYYQTITSNSYNGYFETFMGDCGTMIISESSQRGSLYPEPAISLGQWDKWVKKGYLIAPRGASGEAPHADETARLYASPSVELMDQRRFTLPELYKGFYHQPHLENFFNAVRGKEKLNCPGEVGYETAVTVLKTNAAAAAGRTLGYSSGEFEVGDESESS